MQTQAGVLEFRASPDEKDAGVAREDLDARRPQRVQQSGAKAKSHSQLYAETLSQLAQPGEFDAIRSES